jgi:two-component system response regulator FlrC
MNLQAAAITGKRILLVEDERAVRDALRPLLATAGHIVVEANNGAEAFAAYLGAKFDLVVTDLEIPFVKGNELAAKIRKVAPRQPILMITAFDHKPGLSNPVDAVLYKPFNSARLLDSIARLLSPNPDAAQKVQADSPFETEIICA